MLKRPICLILILMVSAMCRNAYAGKPDQKFFSDRNYRLLEKMITEHGKNSPGYDPKHRPYVVCDWDNTSAFGDTEETLTYYMMEHLSYTLPVSEFRRAISLNVPRGRSKLFNNDGKPVIFDDLIGDMVDDYSYIYKNYGGLAGNKGLEEIRTSEEYRDLAAKLFVMFDALAATSGTAVADQWQGQLMSGMTSKQLMELSDKSIRDNLGDRIRKIKLSGSDKLKRRCNGVSSTISKGLRTYPGMIKLYRSLMDNGIDVYIVSASPEDIVVPIACSKEYGYRLPRENVFGAKFAKINGVLQPELSHERAMTWGPGKVELIKKRFITQKGYQPLLVCGDSDGDYNMLSEFPGMKLGLIINRLKGGNIGSLCEQARKQYGDPNPRYILQGIDENTGTFNAGEATVRFGSTEKHPVK